MAMNSYRAQRSATRGFRTDASSVGAAPSMSAAEQGKSLGSVMTAPAPTPSDPDQEAQDLSRMLRWFDYPSRTKPDMFRGQR